MDRSFKNGFLHFLSDRQRLTEIWRDTVGPDVTLKTSIRGLEMGRLTVEVAGPAYLERYQYYLPKWIKRINIEYGDEIVTEIILRVGES
jgi:hypothetical protein